MTPLIVHRYARLALAAAVALFLVYAAVRATAAGGSATDIGVPFVLVVLGFGFLGLRFVRRTKALQDQAAYQRLVRAHQAKKEARAPARIVGQECGQCARRIVIEADGVACQFCREPVHKGCLASHRMGCHAEAAYR